MLASCAGFAGIAGQNAYVLPATPSSTHLLPTARASALRLVLSISASWGNAGYVIKNRERAEKVLASVQDILTKDEVLALVKAAITGAFAGNDDHHTLMGFRLWPNRTLPSWASDPRFSHVLASVQSSRMTRAGDDKGIAVQQRLKQADSLEQVVELTCDALVSKISNLLSIAEENIDRKRPVVAYGLGSLVAVELRNWITLDLEANVPLMELMNSPSIGNLAGKIAATSRLVD